MDREGDAAGDGRQPQPQPNEAGEKLSPQQHFSQQLLNQQQQSSSRQKKIVNGYAFETRLGQGSFATVYKARIVDGAADSQLPSLVAIKAIKSQRLNSKIKENLALEISILQKFKHPHITQMYWVHKTEKVSQKQKRCSKKMKERDRS